jgi:hypothetical protein
VDLLTRRAGAPRTGHAWRGRPEGRGMPCSRCTAGWCNGPPRPARVRRGHRWPAATAADPECQPAARCARAARPRPCRDACSKRPGRGRDERRSCRGVPWWSWAAYLSLHDDWIDQWLRGTRSIARVTASRPSCGSTMV